MRNIKDLGIVTKEGISIKNLQRFPSEEWGPEGGFCADVYLNQEYIGHLHQSGNGGCPSFTFNGVDVYKKLAEAGIVFLKRVNKMYSSDSPYKWLRNKTANLFQDDDIEAIIISIEERYDHIKAAKKSFKQGYKALAIIMNDYEERYLNYRVPDITVAEVRKHMVQHNLTQYTEIEIISCTDNLSVL